jgi:hypothetical protein
VGLGAVLGLVSAAVAAFLWYMIAVPGRSAPSALPPLTDEERALIAPLEAHVRAIASSEHNLHHPAALEAAARYLEQSLEHVGYRVASQPVESVAIMPRDLSRERPVDRPANDRAAAVSDRAASMTTARLHPRNLEVELRGAAESGIIIVGAHYDSVQGAPGANDNGSGVAAVLELARLFRDWRPRHTWRFVLFVNEEQPYFQTDMMGSAAYVRRAQERREPIVAMFSLETIGYFSGAPGSQHYPFPLGLFYPTRGNFLAFVANLGSRALLHETIAAFRSSTQFPSEGVAAPSWVPGVDWSDQWAFWRAGFRALMVTDTALYRYPHYHTLRDTPDKLDYERLARIVRGLERTFRELDEKL